MVTCARPARRSVRAARTTLPIALTLASIVAPCAAQPCGPQWLPGEPDASLDDDIITLTPLSDGGVVAGGQFSAIGGVAVNKIAQWDGQRWRPMGSGVAGGTAFGFSGFVFATAVLPGGDVIAAGNFTITGGVPASNIARWNGAAWSALGDGLGGPDDGVAAVRVMPNGDIVAAGKFQQSGGVAVNNIARWNGAAWSPLGSGIEAPASLVPIYALEVLNDGSLAAAGEFDHAGGVPANNVARWNGAAWGPLGAGITGIVGNDAFDRGVHALAVRPNGDLIAGGTFLTAGGLACNNIASWNGSAWSPLGAGITATFEPGGPHLPIFSLAASATGDVFAGGEFHLAGTLAANHVARWDGSAWSPLGVGLGGPLGEYPFAHQVAMMHNGDVAVSGLFTTAGGLTSRSFARWTDTARPWTAVQPQSRTLAAGDTLSLTAGPANGYSNLNVQWLRDGSPIANGSGGASPGGGIVSGASGPLASPSLRTVATLTITNAAPSDAGVYSARFSNACGSTLSTPASVTIETPCPCPADFDGSGGTPDATDITAFFDAWLAGDPAADADCSGGTPDLSDITVFFVAWLAGGC